ncbi:MAG: protein kinase [Actinomycetaceae bacterium]|nr:protein kinase [Actinomycetaceae bacterium]
MSSSRTTPSRIGQSLGGRYTLLAHIAQGGMGEVWKARDKQTGLMVAAKVLRPELSGEELSLSRLRIEARNAMRIQHPNIANVLDSGEDDGRGWIIMELVEGRPLTAYLARGSRIAAADLLPLILQVAMALDAAQAAGVVHRDIKPANILVRADGMVKLTDFGISRTRDQVSLTAVGMVMGTAQYLPPEQAMGEAATSSGDLYALGVIAYEAIAGRRPFTGQTQVDIAFSHVNDPVPPLPRDVPPAFAKVIYHLLEKDPSKRPESGTALVRELTVAANDMGCSMERRPLPEISVGKEIRGPRSGRASLAPVRHSKRTHLDPSLLAPVDSGEGGAAPRHAAPARADGPPQRRRASRHQQTESAAAASAAPATPSAPLRESYWGPPGEVPTPKTHPVYEEMDAPPSVADQPAHSGAEPVAQTRASASSIREGAASSANTASAAGPAGSQTGAAGSRADTSYAAASQATAASSADSWWGQADLSATSDADYPTKRVTDRTSSAPSPSQWAQAPREAVYPDSPPSRRDGERAHTHVPAASSAVPAAQQESTTPEMAGPVTSPRQTPALSYTPFSQRTAAHQGSQQHTQAADSGAAQGSPDLSQSAPPSYTGHTSAPQRRRSDLHSPAGFTPTGATGHPDEADTVIAASVTQRANSDQGANSTAAREVLARVAARREAREREEAQAGTAPGTASPFEASGNDFGDAHSASGTYGAHVGAHGQDQSALGAGYDASSPYGGAGAPGAPHGHRPSAASGTSGFNASSPALAHHSAGQRPQSPASGGYSHAPVSAYSHASGETHSADGSPTPAQYSPPGPSLRTKYNRSTVAPPEPLSKRLGKWVIIILVAITLVLIAVATIQNRIGPLFSTQGAGVHTTEEVRTWQSPWPTV